MHTSLKRYELEDYVEAQLLEIAESLIPDSPGSDDLKAAKDYFPEFFGGAFPHLGLSVVRTAGESKFFDKPEWPGLLVAEVRIYEPCLPVRGADHPQDDRIKSARRITRQLRALFLEKLIVSSFGRHCVGVPDSRGGWIDEVGNPTREEQGKWFLWTDLTQLPITA